MGNLSRTPRPNLKWRKRAKNRSRQAIRPHGQAGVVLKMKIASLRKSRVGECFSDTDTDTDTDNPTE
jgi:hypothetical protein